MLPLTYSVLDLFIACGRDRHQAKYPVSGRMQRPA